MALEENIIKENSRVLIKSNKLNIDSIPNYNLNLFLSPYEFGFSIIDSEENRCLRLESVIFKEPFTAGKTDEVLLKIFQDNHLLPAAFWKSINLFISNRCYTFVPEIFYKEELSPTILAYNCNFDAETHECKSIAKQDFQILYGVELSIKNLFKKIYPNRTVNFYPSIYNLIEKSKSNKTVVHLYQDTGMLTLVVFKNGNFEYCNTFNYKNTDDVLYYTMLVYKELNLNTEEVATVISGSTENQNILQNRMTKYIKKVDLKSRPEHLKLCYNFDELEENRFFNLLNIQING